MLGNPSISLDEAILPVKVSECGQSAGKFALFLFEKGITPQRLHAEHPNSNYIRTDGDIV